MRGGKGYPRKNLQEQSRVPTKWTHIWRGGRDRTPDTFNVMECECSHHYSHDIVFVTLGLFVFCYSGFCFLSVCFITLFFVFVFFAFSVFSLVLFSHLCWWSMHLVDGNWVIASVPFLLFFRRYILTCGNIIMMITDTLTIFSSRGWQLCTSDGK